MRSNRWFIRGAWLAFVVICLTAPPAAGQTDSPTAPGSDYRPGNYGRVRYEENGLTIVREESGGARDYLSAGHVNTPIFVGDALATGPNQRAEAQLANGSLVRVDQYSHVVFSALPDPYPETLDETALVLDQGDLRLESSPDDQKDIRIETPGCNVFVGADADLRVAVRGGRTRVATRRGMARIESGGSSLVLRAGMVTEVIGGAPPFGPRPYNSFLADSFDRWVTVRQSRSAANLGLTPEAEAIHEALPAQVQPYFRELSLHGMWVKNEQFGYAWVPQVPGSGWRPYRVGHWGYGQRGYFWVSHEPWGWAPYHYGRWIWLEELGWTWVPGTVFGGAWVSWSWGPNHVGWAALDFWNMPARRSPVDDGILDLQSWTIVPYEHVGRPDLVKYHVQVAGDTKFEFLATVRRTPAVPPNRLAEPRSRSEAIAAATRDDLQANQPAADDGAMTDVRRSFLELERQGASIKDPTGQTRATAQIASPAPGDLRQAEFRPANITAQSSPKLEETNGGIVVQGRPAAMRPVVRFEQQADGVSERWKLIYHAVAQPRSTQSQADPPESSPMVVESEPQSSPPPPASAPQESNVRRSTEKKRGERLDRSR